VTLTTGIVRMNQTTRFAALMVPIPVAKSYPIGVAMFIPLLELQSELPFASYPMAANI
jgi:hypothetical protein